jgi:hypothetical protein
MDPGADPGFPQRAGVGSEKLDAIELAWLRMGATRPNEEALR